MKVIGITGGVGCGKSTIIDILKNKQKVKVLKADDIAKALYEPGMEAYNSLIKMFGDSILLPDNTIDKSKLANLIYSSKYNRIAVNNLIHPLVKDNIQDEIKKCFDSDYDLCLVEAALFFEDNYQEMCDEVWYIYADENIRRKRLKESRFYTDERIDSIIASQLSEDEFRKRCDIVIDNSDSYDKTVTQLVKILGL